MPDTSAWQLRVATLDDLDAIMRLERSTFENDAWSEASMRSEIANPSARYLVAEPVEPPREVVAYGGVLAPRRSGQADIQTIAVAPAARRTGLGRTLMHALITEARLRGAEQIFLEVRADNPNAQQLYDSLGFEALAVRAGYYQPDNVDAIVMRLTVPSPIGGQL